MSVAREPVRVLFVCVENSCRSQMAEGFAAAFGGPGISPFSAGSKPSGIVDPRAIRMMAERGIALATHHSKGLGDLPSDHTWDWIVTMGCGDACPWLPARHRRDWDLPDPKTLDDDGFRSVRDRIEARVRELLEEAAAESRAAAGG